MRNLEVKEIEEVNGGLRGVEAAGIILGMVALAPVGAGVLAFGIGSAAALTMFDGFYGRP